MKFSITVFTFLSTLLVAPVTAKKDGCTYKKKEFKFKGCENLEDEKCAAEMLCYMNTKKEKCVHLCDGKKKKSACKKPTFKGKAVCKFNKPEGKPCSSNAECAMPLLPGWFSFSPDRGTMDEILPNGYCGKSGFCEDTEQGCSSEKLCGEDMNGDVPFCNPDGECVHICDNDNQCEEIGLNRCSTASNIGSWCIMLETTCVVGTDYCEGLWMFPGPGFTECKDGKCVK